MTETACAARDPRTCRYHGLLLQAETALHDGDMDAYLAYRTRAEARAALPQPEEFFTPTNEREELVSVAQLRKIGKSGAPAETLSQPYRAEIDYGSEYQGRYRRYAKKQGLKFTEARVDGGRRFTFKIDTVRDAHILLTMIEDGQDKLDTNEDQAAYVAARTN